MSYRYSSRSNVNVNYNRRSCGCIGGGKAEANFNWFNGQGGDLGFNFGSRQDNSGSIGGGSRGGFASGSMGGYGGGGSEGSYGFGGHYGGGNFDGAGGDGTGGFGASEGLLSVNEKQTMQNLNDRLDKVSALEEANKNLEAKITEWYEKNHPGTTTGEKNDYTKYYQTIEEIQAQIRNAYVENATIILAIDNSRLAADDFKMKYENELHLCQNTEADINGLRNVLDGLTLTNTDMESQIESLTEDLAYLKKSHEEEAQSQQTTTIGQVNVEMDAAPGKDLTKILNDMRAEYEAMVEKNCKLEEDLFKKKIESVKKDISAGEQNVQTSKTEITSLRQSLQSLEMELQFQYAMKKSLEETLGSTEGNYCMQISQLQIVINSVEEQLSQLKSDMECQKSEYEMLLDIKTQLEQEIKKYKELLEGGDFETGTATGSRPGTETGSSSIPSAKPESTASRNSAQSSSTTIQSTRSSTISNARSESSSSQRSGSRGLDSGRDASGSSMTADQRSSVSGSSGTGRSGDQRSSGYGGQTSEGAQLFSDLLLDPSSPEPRIYYIRSLYYREKPLIDAPMSA
ncbi:keratin, type I cytoskeletal 12-like [Pelodytes ibericus]